MKWALYEALRTGGSIPKIRKNAIKFFKESTNLRSASKEAYDEALIKMQSEYTTEMSLRRDAAGLLERGYRVVVRGKGLDTYLRIVDGKE